MELNLFKFSTKIYLFAFMWLIPFAAQMLLLYCTKYDITLACIDSVINSSLWCTSAMCVFNILRYYTPNEKNYAIILSWAIGLSAIEVYLHWELANYFISEQEYLLFIKQGATIRLLFTILFLAAVVLFIWVLYYIKIQRDEERRRAQTEKLAKDAELHSLRQQIQPHFLFNSLNSINSLIHSQPSQAREMVLHLSEFLRGTLHTNTDTLTVLSDEIHQLNLYLAIEKVRFKERLHVTINIEDQAKQALIPPLLLQPVVENAIKFGLYGTLHTVNIVIQASIQQQLLLIQISNPVDKDTLGTQKGTGFGLSSIKRRLYLLFARQDLLDTTLSDQLFITSIKIPQSI